jgi:hypothetical protein
VSVLGNNCCLIIESIFDEREGIDLWESVKIEYPWKSAEPLAPSHTSRVPP